jgi:hypothetical protein
MAKANDKIINKSIPEFSWTEVEAPGGIITKDGNRIDCTVVVPDGMFGYGDNQSLASMTGDTVDRVSTDSKAGEKAYETALEQADQDQIVRRRKVRNQMEMAKYPAADMSYDPSNGVWDLRYMREDRETGMLSLHNKTMTDAEVGHVFERYQDRQRQKDE